MSGTFDQSDFEEKKDDAIVELDRNTIGGLNDDFTQGAEGNQPDTGRDTSKINDTSPHKWTGKEQNF